MASTSVCRSCLRTLRHSGARTTSEASLHPHRISLQTRHHTSLYRAHGFVSVGAANHHPRYPRRAASSSAATAKKPRQPPPEPPTAPGPETFDARTTEPASSEHTIANAATETLFKECARQADYTVPQAFEASGAIPKNAAGEDLGEGVGVWYGTGDGGFGLAPTFSAWAQVTMLHLWLLAARLRMLQAQRAAMWTQHLLDHFFFEAEHRMTIFHKVHSRAVRQRYLKLLHDQWRGALGAYDQGLAAGDAVLAAAVWRNVFRGGQGGGGGGGGERVMGGPGAGQPSRADDATGAAAAAREGGDGEGDAARLEAMQEMQDAAFDWRRVACVVAFVRRGARRLALAPDSVVMQGKVRFGDPMDLWEAVVGVESARLDEAFGEADDEAYTSWREAKGDAAQV